MPWCFSRETFQQISLIDQFLFVGSHTQLEKHNIKDIINSGKLLLSLYEASAKDSGATSINQKQAMHIVYARAGEVDTAKRLLLEVKHGLMAVDNDQKIYTVAKYTFVSSREFNEINNKMIEALDRNELWDGEKLNIDGNLNINRIKGDKNNGRISMETNHN